MLRALRRTDPLVPAGDAAGYLAFLRRCFVDVPLERTLPRLAVRRLAPELGFDRGALPRDLDAGQWAALYRELGAAPLRPATRRRGGSARGRRPS